MDKYLRLDIWLLGNSADKTKLSNYVLFKSAACEKEFIGCIIIKTTYIALRCIPPFGLKLSAPTRWAASLLFHLKPSFFFSILKNGVPDRLI